MGKKPLFPSGKIEEAKVITNHNIKKKAMLK